MYRLTHFDRLSALLDPVILITLRAFSFDAAYTLTFEQYCSTSRACYYALVIVHFASSLLILSVS